MTRLHKILSLLFALLLSISLQSCDHDEPDSGRTLIVYMVANNNLTHYAGFDLDEMKIGIKKSSAGRLIAYVHQAYSDPKLIEIHRDGSTEILKTYDTSISSASIARMREAIDDARQTAPDSNYGLILWSHATGWLSDAGSIEEPTNEQLAPFSFGSDGLKSPQKMKLPSLAKALEGLRFDFIYFDCCHMATVEVAYELRHITPLIAASPTELGLDGMPYDSNLRLLMSSKLKLEAAIKNTYESYNHPGSDGCSISLISTEAIDRLATLSRKALSNTPSAGYDPVPYFRSSVLRTGIFDMNHYFQALTAADPELAAEWQTAFKAVVSAAYSTPIVYGLDASDFAGLGCHILSPQYPASAYEYDATAWYRDVVAPAIR